MRRNKSKFKAFKGMISVLVRDNIICGRAESVNLPTGNVELDSETDQLIKDLRLQSANDGGDGTILWNNGSPSLPY